MKTRDVQAALLSLGFDPKGIDGDWGNNSKAAMTAFQRSRKLPASGMPDAESVLALQSALAERGEPRSHAGIVPSDWMPAVRMERIIVHWTAGAHRASGLDKSHYHILIEADGKLVRGTPSIALNDARGAKAGYAAHTLNCNTGSIGVSLCCMAGAIESPFKAGSAPMTMAQWETLPVVLADLCRCYGIAVMPRTVLSHAEVQGTLGIKQRGKWDIARVVPVPSLIGAKACGDAFRAATAALL